MIAIIPVAGVGTNLRPHTYTQPKSLIPVAGKPILGFIIDQLLVNGIQDFVFVIGYLGEKIKEYVERDYPSIKKKYVVQEIREGLGHAVWLTRNVIPKNSEVMILGAGEMSRITAQSLVSRGAKSIFVTNRSFERAQELAAEMNGSAVRFDDWQRVLERVDVVISSTGAPHAIVMREDVEKARRARKYRPLFFIDIAVPRDIDPAVGEIEEVYLYDIDTLEQLAQEARSRRQQQIEDCERIIDAELAKSNLPGT